MFALTIRRLLGATYRAVADLRWWVLGLVILAHSLVSWALLALAGEAKLLGVVDFIYWYATTASTVGYGDLSPQTAGGRLVTAVFVFPGAVAIFTTVVAKTLNKVGDAWRRRRLGKGNYSKMEETIVLIGFDTLRTPRMIEELSADADYARRLVLVTREPLEAPDSRVAYVHAPSLTSAADLRRAGVESASRIAVYGATDEETLAAALAVAAMNRTGHIVCFFNSPDGAELLRQHCPAVETIVAPGAELVARSVRDPGASQVLGALISHLDRSATLFSLEWSQEARAFSAIAQTLLQSGATLLATRGRQSAEPVFNPGAEALVEPGDRIYYVAQDRLRGPELAGA